MPVYFAPMRSGASAELSVANFLQDVRQRAFGVKYDGARWKQRIEQRWGPLHAELEQIVRTFLHGYNSAIADSDVSRLTATLERVDLVHRGFAFEGAAMGITMFDIVTFSGMHRLAAFLAGPGKPHVYMVHVGAGWAAAKLGRRPQSFFRHLDPTLRWLVVDGYGFYKGFFNAERTIDRRHVPDALTGYARRAFDQGLGRCLWFVGRAQPETVGALIRQFNHERRADLWSGVGLACACAGAVDVADIENLRACADGCCAELAQGAAFAAKVRITNASVTNSTECACRAFCGMSASDAAAVTDDALLNLPNDGDDELPRFEHWRRRIQTEFAGKT